MSEPDLYSLSSYLYHLPEELIAQYPCKPRDSSRLMIVDRSYGSITITQFRELPNLLKSGDGLVFNDTRVIPARLIGKRKNGGEAEVFLIRRHADGTWDALVRPGKKLPLGSIVEFNPNFSCQIVDIVANGERRVKFYCQSDLDQMLEQSGQIPLPHYIKRNPTFEDRELYQTVYAANPGALAAPTAGLHFTQEMLEDLLKMGISQTNITLHVGLGTFRPAKTPDIRAHEMHAERCLITPESASTLNHVSKDGNKLICVGTTSCRTLEAAAQHNGLIMPGEFDTNLFIYPGYQFKCVKNLLTNFHLPGSTLLMLVCALAGYDLVMEAYAKAVENRFRFFSYGDAMLII